MYTPPYSKLVRRLVVIWIVAVMLFAFVYGVFFSPISPFHACTLVGCRDTLELTLSHEPAGQYTLQLTNASGESRRITCTPGVSTATSDASAICRSGIVTIYGYAPASVTVDITWQGGYYDMSGVPVYETFHPNGLFCPPSCRLGKLRLELP